MTRNETDRTDDAALAPFFAEARRRDAEAEVPLALMARILGDADAVRMPALPRRAARPAGALDALRAAFGGWRGVTAMAACGAAGIWIGMSDVSETASAMVWTGRSAVASEDPVAAFFDLAASEV